MRTSAQWTWYIGTASPNPFDVVVTSITVWSSKWPALERQNWVLSRVSWHRELQCKLMIDTQVNNHYMKKTASCPFNLYSFFSSGSTQSVWFHSLFHFVHPLILLRYFIFDVRSFRYYLHGRVTLLDFLTIFDSTPHKTRYFWFCRRVQAFRIALISQLFKFTFDLNSFL